MAELSGLAQIGTQMELLRMETERKEAAVPALILFMLLEGMFRQTGEHVRPDFAQALNVAQAAALARLPEQNARRLAARIDADAKDILRYCYADNNKVAILATCRWVLDLVGRGRLNSQASVALVSLAIMDEAQKDPGAGWGWREGIGAKATNEMAKRAETLGYFGKIKLVTPDQVPAAIGG